MKIAYNFNDMICYCHYRDMIKKCPLHTYYTLSTLFGEDDFTLWATDTLSESVKNEISEYLFDEVIDFEIIDRKYDTLFQKIAS